MPNAVSGPGPYHFLDLAYYPTQKRWLLYGPTLPPKPPEGQSMTQNYL